MSDWQVINAGMPQGSYLGPLMLITLVDSLWTSCPMHKFVDDTTLSVCVAKSTTSCMKACCDELVQQSEEIRMMLIGPMAKDPPPLLSLCGATVERVPVFKLLGVHASSDLKWTKHISTVVSKAASRLYFLKQFEANWCANQGPAPFLHHSSAAGPRVCVSSMAPWIDCCTLWIARVSAEARHPVA